MYDTVYEKNRALYYANVTELDYEIGRVLKALDDAAVSEQTFVLFTSDNGPEVLNRKSFTARSYGTAGDLRGMKLDLYEGGIRVPALLRWPGVIIDGFNLQPLLRGKTLKRGTPLYWQYDNAHTSEPNDLPVPKLALREGDWKLLAHTGFTNYELYHLKSDPRERVNLNFHTPKPSLTPRWPKRAN